MVVMSMHFDMETYDFAAVFVSSGTHMRGEAFRVYPESSFTPSYLPPPNNRPQTDTIYAADLPIDSDGSLALTCWSVFCGCSGCERHVEKKRRCVPQDPNLDAKNVFNTSSGKR